MVELDGMVLSFRCRVMWWIALGEQGTPTYKVHIIVCWDMRETSGVKTIGVDLHPELLLHCCVAHCLRHWGWGTVLAI